MLELDGSAGGGQLLRTALSLSAVTGTPFEMSDVRGARDDPGLRPQHLTAVEVLAAVTDAAVEGAEPGATELTFRPGPPQPGHYEADIGTAGSLALLFDALLPLAVELDAPLSLAATGGTDVQWSPTAAHYRRVKLPLLRRHGLAAAVDEARPGFYPAATLYLAPSRPEPLALRERTAFAGARVYSTAATELADAGVARRQADAAAERLADAGLDPVERVVRTGDADCPGSAVCVRLDYGTGVAGFDALGERGTPAEEVGAAAADGAVAFDAGPGAVDGYLADQLVVVLALAGGTVRVPAVTDHVRTAVELVGEFGRDVTVEERERGALLSA
ncbi:MAG: RNA 3'-terminal phosphate cyclase [Halobacteriaceae archaeon]